MKKILLIVPKLSNGGTERVAANISTHLAKEKYEVHFVLFYNDSVDFPINGEIHSLMTLPPKRGFGGVFVNFLKRLYGIYRLKRKYNFDVSISFESQPNLLNILTKFHDRVLLTVHTYKSKENNHSYKKLYNLIIKNLFGRADKIVSVCNKIKEDLIVNYKLPKDKIHRIYNFFDIDDIRKQSLEKLDENVEDIFKKPVIISVGRISYEKGWWNLIKSFSLLVAEDKDFQLVILGIGDYKDKLLELADNLGVIQNVHFLGFTRNPFKYLVRSKYFALTSVYEGFPNVLIEALACQVVIVTTDCTSGPRELVEPDMDLNIPVVENMFLKYGVLTPYTGSKEDFSNNLTQEQYLFKDAILELENNPTLYESYKVKCLERAYQLDGKSMIKLYEDLFS